MLRNNEIPINYATIKLSRQECISLFYPPGTGGGLFGGDDRVVYWKCESGQTLKESIHVPITNKAKERALLMAAQQVKSITVYWNTVNIL